jgi:hypothetical protein
MTLKNMLVIQYLAFGTIVALCSCSDDDIDIHRVALPETVNQDAVTYVEQNAKDTKVIENYDFTDGRNYVMSVGENSPSAAISGQTVEDAKEGLGALAVNYTFAAKSISTEPEYVTMKEFWGNYRTDLSFHPLGLSLWIKGNSQNPGVLRVMLIQDSKMEPGIQMENQYFQYINKSILQQDGWQKLIIPYESFQLYKGLTPDDKLNLSKVFGYRIDIVNEKDESGTGTVYFDALEQVTSYQHQYEKKGKFSSMFIQLNKVYYENPEYDDWETYFTECKKVGIDTWIVQYSVGYGAENTISWYSGSTVGWNGEGVQTECPIIDKIMNAAKKTGFKIILGLNGGDYNIEKLDDKWTYDVLLARNEVVAGDLARKYANHPSFAGWYITEEFHDAKYPAGWQEENKRKLLSDYLTRVATFAKSKCNKPVYIAPALWRGMPAEMCGEWFGALLKETENVDYMYLQDLGGRSLVDVRIDLPNYYGYIKKACEEAGVKFGVDIESFFYSYYPPVDYRAKTWAELEEQLAVASQYTDLITNFSWATFKPGYDSFEGYRNYYNSLK